MHRSCPKRARTDERKRPGTEKYSAISAVGFHGTVKLVRLLFLESGDAVNRACMTFVRVRSAAACYMNRRKR